MLIEDIISEKYINIIGNDDKALRMKEKYKDQVWHLLQKSYAPIGGIKGSGFETPEAMVKQIPLWKLGVRNGKVRAVVLYKDKNGRKSVAIGTDGSDESKWFINDIMKNDIYRSYSEKSKASLGKLMKTVPWDTLKKYVVPVDKVSEIIHDHIIPITSVPKDLWPEDAKLTLFRYPQLKPYGYLRKIGNNGELIFKVMLGTPKKSIIGIDIDRNQY